MCADFLGYPGPQDERTQIRSSVTQGPALIDNCVAILNFDSARRTLEAKERLVKGRNVHERQRPHSEALT